VLKLRDDASSPAFSNLDQRLASLATTRDDCLYYTLTFTADDKGNVICDSMSHFAGWSPDRDGWELRVPRLVKPHFGEVFWRQRGYPFACFHSRDELPLFFMGGGNALIEQTLFAEEMPDFLEPSTTVRVGNIGFVDPDALDPVALRRAPTPKLRMAVLKRDDYRCKICGRRPSDYVDLELHVHHARPWAKGGLTLLENLITLCHTCHSGLDPHFEAPLIDLIPHKINESRDEKLEDFLKGVANYRRLVFAGEL
jgi:hypothetical protein